MKKQRREFPAEGNERTSAPAPLGKSTKFHYSQHDLNLIDASLDELNAEAEDVLAYQAER